MSRYFFPVRQLVQLLVTCSLLPAALAAGQAHAQQLSATAPTPKAALRALSRPLPDVVRLANLQYQSPDVYYDHDAGILVLTQGCTIHKLLGEAYLLKGKALDARAPKAKNFPQDRELRLIHRLDDYQNGVIRFQGEEDYCALASMNSAYPVLYQFSAVKQYQDYSAARELLDANTVARIEEEPRFGFNELAKAANGVVKGVKTIINFASKSYEVSAHQDTIFEADETRPHIEKAPANFPLATPYFVGKVLESRPRPLTNYVAFELEEGHGCEFEFARFAWLAVAPAESTDLLAWPEKAPGKKDTPQKATPKKTTKTTPASKSAKSTSKTTEKNSEPSLVYRLFSPHGQCRLSSNPVEASTQGIRELRLPNLTYVRTR